MRALLSVYDKRGIVEFAQALTATGWEIVSTGGTLTALREAGLPALSVAEVTGFPEILDGRVKTLHPKIHGGLLARRDLPDHLASLETHGIVPFDVLAVNLYPFEATVSDPDVAEIDAVEQIDIGGPAMLRAAAKNFATVIVVTDPDDYDAIVHDIEHGGPAHDRRRALAAKAFAHTAAYDTLVSSYLGGGAPTGDAWPEEIAFAGRHARSLRYGENPQQRGAAYRRLSVGRPYVGVLDARQLGGPELSFNNLLDADAAWGAIQGIEDPAVAIVKHTIPCGLATRPDLVEAFEAALAGDPVSAFGGIVALNRPVDARVAAHLIETLFHVVIAPAFDDDALARLTRKKQLRLLAIPTDARSDSDSGALDIRPIRGGFLVQDADTHSTNDASWRTVTRRPPSPTEYADLRFAWEAVRHVKSNAIVLVNDRAVVGVGAGQPNRVESVRIAVKTAGYRAAGSVLASDAFFPFADGMEAALAAGVTAAVQPGGSVKDAEVIAAVDAADAAMVFTGVRHFRH
ncbi:MAG TPA: bifunctional phosphoribosylaminoimidazolecarboxamide formyltransferase/IMP cyclohydrolase [Thermomicrobiales bacterium]